LAEVFPRTISALHHCMATFMDSKVNLIVDHVLQRRDWLEECVNLLDGRRVLFVGVFCDPDEVRRKESRRKAPAGLGDSQAASVHAHALYDLKVDSFSCHAGEIAKQIIETQNSQPLPTAFQQLKEMFARGELS
jgi:chloramphenicol 3-O phosphotransferase